MSTIIRHHYIEKLAELQDKNLIKVITGVRRCGKSTLMKQFQDRIKKQVRGASVISINLDDPKMRALAEGGWRQLYDFILSKLKPSVKNYIFLDEIQNVANFERLLEGLFVHPDIDLYVTGSNAYLLSSELATLLTGRAFEINVLPFSFAEYIQYQGNENNLPQHFAKYARLGGFPEAVNLATTNEVLSAQYLQQVYRSILENDISQRHKIYSEESYQNVVNFLIDSVGSRISAGNIANVLTSSGKKIDNKSVSRYIGTLVESYLLYEAKRYDIKGKALLKTQEKYYLVDTGLRNALVGRELGSNAGHLLENIVYLELLRRDNAVWIGKIDSQEVDFIVRDKNGYTQYIQVAQTVASDETLKRELAPFAKIRDHHEKILLTTDWENGSHSGVKQLNVFEWLLK